MRAIYIKQSGQNVLVATCADNQVHDDPHPHAYTSNFTFSSLPACTPEIRQYIDAHPYTTLSLWAVEESTDQVRLRTPAEMSALPHVAWANYNLKDDS